MHAMTRREVLSLVTTSFLGLSLFPSMIFAEESLPAGISAEATIYIDGVNSSGSTWATYQLDSNGELEEVCRMERLDSTTINDIPSMRSGALAVSIAVYVGKAIVGYVVASVIDGIVIAATGQSGATWASIAIKRLVGNPVPSSKTVYLSCSIYPPHSMEYIRCINA